MTQYWQAKLQGLLNTPVLSPLYPQDSTHLHDDWHRFELPPLSEDSPEPEAAPSALADAITAASDRAAIRHLNLPITYSNNGLTISHLLSGANQTLKLQNDRPLLTDPTPYLQEKQAALRAAIPEGLQDDPKALFWWFWRCLPVEVCRQFQDEALMLLPADPQFPDASIWTHTSMTAAFTGALTGDQRQPSEDGPKGDRPYLASFTFSPIQELIKASRKIRDFWAGSWVLHYLCAKVAYKLAQTYGPDSLLYPSLYQQPLIDLWLRQDYPNFRPWIDPPSDRALLTAGFPNVLMLVLPKQRVKAAMQTARQTLLQAWMEIADEVLGELQQKRHWLPHLKSDASSWGFWLKTQWQTYWSAVPIGEEGEPLSQPSQASNPNLDTWINQQNRIYPQAQLFPLAELQFLQSAQPPDNPGELNIGSWWADIFGHARASLSQIKNARTWELPTAFGPRSTISGVGPVVHPGPDWISEQDSKRHWRREAGFFDGIEALNATETLKRGLEKVLPQLLNRDGSQRIAPYYPDLTSGVAGYLRTHPDHQPYYQQVCQTLLSHPQFPWLEAAIADMKGKWGIPLIDESHDNLKDHPPRLLNPGWLVEDADDETIQQLQRQLDQEQDSQLSQTYRQQLLQRRRDYREQLQQELDQHYPNNNPSDWYVLAAGDGDGMSDWLKGKKMGPYGDYLPQALRDSGDPSLQEFLTLPKRMGPATHSALSRSLLDFSNQLVPYLTERRYAGRLIYSGGDDILAYSNLWEWDRWLWDIRQCFRGQADPEFNPAGQYWQWRGDDLPQDGQGRPLLSRRPLFTLGERSTISFGLVIAHHSVPLAIALGHLWDAETGAKDHQSPGPNGQPQGKDALQVRVLYGSGNCVTATSKFSSFQQWQTLMTLTPDQPSLFELAASLWSDHPAPKRAAIAPWTQAFCQRRDSFSGDPNAQQAVQQALQGFIEGLWDQTDPKDLDGELKAWLKLAAFVQRKRTITLNP
ncbi:type III-B CRISPR-associated protein Cas10/Cmr2 [Sodalinema gerasimenkoae]|uniref:type III-B CRISPR-associated protein Cas10/Cmr2 n=1 Tax=Sodalinema gerasimenkoae TaxID=2862348 RepID=UPI001FE62818|nr:type III-B CRISPR-associated protein Cas10/Cmr2 [Sodalinema gerasimenkoae]